MSKILLLSHSDLCKAFYETAEKIMGKMDDSISYILLPYGSDLNQYQSSIEHQVIDAGKEGILILTDLFGGSPFMIASRVYEQYIQNVPIEIVTGLNLPMVLEIASIAGKKSASELKEIAINVGTDGIVDFSRKLSQKRLEDRKEAE